MISQWGITGKRYDPISNSFVCLLRVLRVICQGGIIEQRNDPIVDSLQVINKVGNYRQPNNKSTAVYHKDFKDVCLTIMEVGKPDTLCKTALTEVVN